MERLQKRLARAGVGSRRACEALIEAGRVTVNGQPATLGMQVDESAAIAIDGRPIAPLEALQYVLLYKPRGVVSTASDPQGRITVVDLVPNATGRLYPVGRLDRDSEGLLLLTNDGELTLRLLHPRYHVEKEYLVSVRGSVTPAVMQQWRNGVALDDGRTAPAEVDPLDEGRLRVVLREGRTRQIRRMAEATGLEVTRLRRVRMGPLRLGRLVPGQSRELTAEELQQLRAVVGLEKSR